MAGFRSRMPGGGRKKIRQSRPEILKELDSLIDPLTRGDPESPLRWTCKSTRRLAEVLQSKGYLVSHQTVANLLKDLGYSLQANAKKAQGSSHQDRDAQFQYINNLSKEYINQDCPSDISRYQKGRGLRVEAMLDENKYQTKIKVSAKEMARVNIHRHAFHGEWNYTIKPATRL